MPPADHYQHGEIKLHGMNLCKTVWTLRPDDVVKIYVARSSADRFQRLLSEAAARRKAFKLVDEGELERLTQSVHHEGICFIARDVPSPSGEDVIARLVHHRDSSCVLALDGVHNPHNVGNILRTSAHFGVADVLMGNMDGGVLPPSARRVSEGGCEFVSLADCGGLTVALKCLKSAGWEIVGASSYAEDDLFGRKLGGKCVLVLGNEMSGLSPSVAGACDRFVSIPGTGKVESLNVATSAALLMAEYFRARSSASGG